MSILDALKKLITNRGGTAKGSNIAEVINNYANEDSPSPSGGGTFIIHGIQDGSYVTMDKTFREIRDAMLAGKQPIFIFPLNNDPGPDDARIFTVSYLESRNTQYEYPECMVGVDHTNGSDMYYANDVDGYPGYSYD